MRSIVLVCLAGAAAAASAQDFSRPNTDLCERSFISDAVPGQFWDRRQADDFRLNSALTVNSIRWWGGIAPFPPDVIDLTNVEAFRIVIYEDLGGEPNSLALPIYDGEFGKAETNPRPTGFEIFNNQGGLQFEHTVQLPQPLMIPGNTTLWITIGSRNVDPSGAGWRWSSSLTGDFRSAQQLPWGGAWEIFDPSAANYTVEFNPAPDGAICLPSGGCVIGTAEQAFTAGGLYLGDGTDCASADCEPFAVFTRAPSQPCNPSFNSDAVPGQFAGTLSVDTFELEADAVVDGVRWWGGSQFFQDFDLFNFESWTVTIYAGDSIGNPDGDSVVYQETFLQDDTDPVLTPYRNRQDADLYEQTVALSEPVALLGGQRYWISIGTTNFDPNGDGWRWAASLDRDGVAASFNWDSGEFAVFEPSGIEYAFQLLGVSDDPGFPGCSPADLAPPFGVLDIFDVLEFLTRFEAQDPGADLAPPFGVWDIFDVLEFLSVFEQGCP